MPLSENEQRQLEAIERALLADDPKFGARVRSTDLRTHSRRRLVRAGVLFVLGFVLLVLTFFEIWLGIVGAVLMFVAALMGLASWKRLRGTPDGVASLPTTRARRSQPRRTSWRERVEERFHRRFEDRD